MSPRFPGMDPFLEGSLWMSVHTQLWAVIAGELAPPVRPEYLVVKGSMPPAAEVGLCHCGEGGPAAGGIELS